MADRVILGEPLPAEQPFPPASQTTTPMPATGEGFGPGWDPIVVALSYVLESVEEHGRFAPVTEKRVKALEAVIEAAIGASPQLLESLLVVEWGGTTFDKEGEEYDACPNCYATKGGLHFTSCELRDSLDAALGVTSPRIERAHG